MRSIGRVRGNRRFSLHSMVIAPPVPPHPALSPAGGEGVVSKLLHPGPELDLAYQDELGRVTQRIIRPLALIYYLDAAVIVGWCELREAIRNFRLDRTQSCAATGAHFRKEGNALRDLWISGWKTQPAA